VRWDVVAPFLLLLLAVAVQFALGAYGRELGANADEPAHFVSGLMVRDYLAHGIGESPVAFAQRYYAHYPKVAIGNWPPAFYVLEGFWLLVLPVRVASALLLIATLAAATAWLVFRAARPVLGAPFALLGAATFLLFQPIPVYTSAVMAEIPVTFAVALATLAWGQCLLRERRRDVLAFGAAAAVAVLTKGNALLLGLLPPLAIVLSGRWRVLRVRVLWGVVALVAAAAGAWLWRYLPTMRAGWPRPDELFGQLGDLGFYPTEMARANGVPLLALAVLGAVDGVRRTARGSDERVAWATAIAAVLATLAFHAVLPGLLDFRHLAPAYPFLAMLVAAGARALARVLRRVAPRPGIAMGGSLALVALLVGLRLRPLRPIQLDGYAAAAATLRTAQGQADSLVVLVASDAIGEGALVTEAALRDPRRPRDVVWRATKLLTLVTWAGRDYTLRADSDTALLALLDGARVGAVVIDRSVAHPDPHVQLLARTAAARPDRLVHLRDLPVRRDGVVFPTGLALYTLVPSAAPDTVLVQRPGYDGVEVVRIGRD
jgi:hypothetical protein